jgi:hypothetical protein
VRSAFRFPYRFFSQNPNLRDLVLKGGGKEWSKEGGCEGPIRCTRWGEWMRADKNSSWRRWRLQQDEHGSQHMSPTHYPSWPSPHSHWNATGPRNQPRIFRTKTHQHA